jgi:glycosyltransferase involved in cell wall biosynthesis
MEITILVGQYARISGGNRALFEYANRLGAMGHKINWIVIAKNFKPYRLDKKLKSWIKGVVRVQPQEIDWLDNKIPINILPGNDSKYIPEADILVATAWQTAEFAAKLPPTAGEKFYFIQHHESLWTRDKEKAQRTYRFPFHKIVISTWLKEIMREKYQQVAEVLVTPVDKDLFFCEKKKWNSPRRVCLLHHDYDWKGYKEGIAAIQKVRSENRKVDLVVFGEKVKDPKPLFDEAGLEFEYHYRPTGKRLREIYSSCDIYLCPSWYEGLGMPAMEAMACRCAVVTTDTGGSRDYAFDKETALVSPPKNIGRLAENLIAVLDDEHLMNQLSENGYSKIQEFNWESACQRLIRNFEEKL